MHLYAAYIVQGTRYDVRLQVIHAEAHREERESLLCFSASGESEELQAGVREIVVL